MGTGSFGVIGTGAVLVLVGIGLLVASLTRGDLLLVRVFHPRTGKPFTDDTARVLLALGILSLLAGILVCVAPPILAYHSVSPAAGPPATSSPAILPPVTTTVLPETTPVSPAPTTEPAPFFPSGEPSQPDDPGDGSGTASLAPLDQLPSSQLLSQLTPLEGDGAVRTDSVKLHGVEYFNPVRLDPAICGKRQINYDISGMGYQTFSASVGLSDTYNDQSDTEWTFAVYVIGANGTEPLFQKNMAFGQVEQFNVPIGGAIRLRLEVRWVERKGLPTCSPLNDFSAVWGDPTLNR